MDENNYRVNLTFDEYIDTILFNGEVRYLGEVDIRGEFDRGYFVSVQSDNIKGGISWEHDMINAALDTFKGTDWSHVNRIIY